MRYLLDTDICIYYLNRRAPAVAERFTSIGLDDLGVSATTAAELRFGALNSGRPARNTGTVVDFLTLVRPVPFDEIAALHYGHIKRRLSAEGKLIGPLDTLIAATALAREATLVTNNVREFTRVPGLSVENWTS